MRKRAAILVLVVLAAVTATQGASSARAGDETRDYQSQPMPAGLGGYLAYLNVPCGTNRIQVMGGRFAITAGGAFRLGWDFESATAPASMMAHLQSASGQWYQLPTGLYSMRSYVEDVEVTGYNTPGGGRAALRVAADPENQGAFQATAWVFRVTYDPEAPGCFGGSTPPPGGGTPGNPASPGITDAPASPTPTPSAPPGNTWSEEWGGTIDCHVYRLNPDPYLGEPSLTHLCWTYTASDTGNGYQTDVQDPEPPIRLHWVAGRTYRVRQITNGMSCSVCGISVAILGATLDYTTTSSTTGQPPTMLDAGSPFQSAAVALTGDWSAGRVVQDRSEILGGTPGADLGYAQFRLGSGGSAFFDGHVRIIVDVTHYVGEPGPTPSPTPAASDPVPTAPASMPPPNYDPPDMNVNVELCPPGSDLAICQPNPMYSFAPASIAPDGVAQLVEELKGRAPIGYAYQAGEALADGIASAPGAALPACLDWKFWHPGGAENVDLCFPWDQIAGAASVVRSILLAIVTILFAVALIRLALHTAEG